MRLRDLDKILIVSISLVALELWGCKDSEQVLIRAATLETEDKDSDIRNKKLLNANFKIRAASQDKLKSECELEFSKGIHRWNKAPTISYFDYRGEPDHNLLQDPDIKSVIDFIEDASGFEIKFSTHLKKGGHNIIVVEHCTALIDGVTAFAPEPSAAGCVNYYGMGLCPEPYSEFNLAKYAFDPSKDCFPKQKYHLFGSADYRVMQALGNPIINGVSLYNFDFDDPYTLRRKTRRKSPVNWRHPNAEVLVWDDDKDHIINTYCLIKYSLKLSMKKRFLTECLIRSFGLYEYFPPTSARDLFLQKDLHYGKPPLKPDDIAWPEPELNFEMPSDRVSTCLEKIYKK